MSELIPLRLIKPLHEVRNRKHFKELAADMKVNKWQGRPLLVIKRKDDYVAWTGSHRIAAAKEAGLSVVECHVVQERDLVPHDVDAEWGHVDDAERLEVIKKIGDEAALHIMWQEGRS